MESDNALIYLMYAIAVLLVIVAWLLTAVRSRIKRIEKQLGLPHKVELGKTPPGHPMSVIEGQLAWANRTAERISPGDEFVQRIVGVGAVACWAAFSIVILGAVMAAALLLLGEW